MIDTNRFLFHSFPRPREKEDDQLHIARGLRILSHMRDAGLVLAPEVVRWNVDAVSGGKEKLEILQRRMCFTELALGELPAHARKFGPFTLACNIQKLRDAGAAPVIYVPQGAAENTLSQISTFAVRGTYHTRAVLQQLQKLKDSSDPTKVEAQFGKPVAPNFTLNLRNTAPDGTVVAGADVPAMHVQDIMRHVGFNNIPFDHSIAVLGIFLNMFYPTDNEHAEDNLGYYRQREWRLIGADLLVNGHQVTRTLDASERAKLLEVDDVFWGREEAIDGSRSQRTELALVYQPTPKWHLWDVVERVLVPKSIVSEAKKILAGLVAVESYSD